MRDPIAPKVARWPFFLGDALLLGLASIINFQTRSPMGKWEIFAYVLCVALGAGFGILPFLLEYRAAVKVAEAEALDSVVAQIQSLERIGAQIRNATTQWQTIQEQADKTTLAAREITEHISAEAKGFTEFMQRMNDNEKAALRLESEKFRRVEAEWLQVLVRMLDHVYALYQAAVRSGQEGLINQLGNFQNACRDAAHRVGLTPFTAIHAETFNEQRHQVLDGTTKPTTGAVVDETIATGYTFQGKLLRPALVRLREVNATDGLQPDSKGAGAIPKSDVERSNLPPESARQD
jgi:molecular chaperone GrpE (heat shock protein)